MQRIWSSYTFVLCIGTAATQPFLTLYLSERNVSSAVIGFILAVGNCAGILAQPLIGYLNDSLSDSRRILFLSAVLSPIVFAGYAVFSSVGMLFVVAVAAAVIQSTGPIADALIVQESTRSGFTYGQVRLWGALSWAITTMVAGYVYHLTSLYWSFAAYAVVAVVLAFITTRLPKTSSINRTRQNALRDSLGMIKDPKLVAFIGMCFFFSCALTINTTYLPLYFKVLHHPLGLVGLNFTVAALVEVPLFYVSGKLMQRFGKVPTLVIASALYAIKCTLMAFGPATFVVIAIQVLDGIAFAMYWSTAVVVIAELAPADRPATAQMLLGAIAGSLSSIVGTSLGGLIFQHFGAQATFAVDGVFAFIACTGFFGFGRWQARRTKMGQPGIPV